MSGPITAVSGFADIAVGRPSSRTVAGGEFQKLFERSIGKLEGLQNEAGRSVERLVSGESEEVHTVVLAAQKAELAFELGLQIRNKVVQAYQEIMRMQM